VRNCATNSPLLKSPNQTAGDLWWQSGSGSVLASTLLNRVIYFPRIIELGLCWLLGASVLRKPLIFRMDVPSAMTQSVRQENGTSRISSKSGRSMRCTEGSSQHRWADVRPDRCPAGRLALRSAVAPGSGMQRLSREALYRTGFSPSTARNR